MKIFNFRKPVVAEPVETVEVVEANAEKYIAATRLLHSAPLMRSSASHYNTSQLNKRSFELARTDRVNSSWIGAGVSFNQEIRYALPRMRALSRDLAQNDPYVKKFLQTISNYIMGPESFTIKNKSYDWVKQPDGTMKKVYDVYANNVIEENFDEFCKRKYCTIKENQSFRQFISTDLRSKVIDGEVFIKFCYPSRGDNKFGVTLQAFEAAMVPEYLNMTLANGNVIVMGIEYDVNLKPVAYYFRKALKGADPLLQYYSNDFTRVDAPDVIHYYDIEFVGQLRGYPRLVAIASRIKTLKGYEEAALVNARSSAMKTMVLEYEKENFGEMGKADIQGAEEDENGDLIQSLEPGSTYVVPKGMRSVSYAPAYPQGEHKMFVENMLYSIASGMGIDYPTMSSNLSGVNYTSIRHGMQDSRLGYKVAQSDIREIIIEPVFKKVLEYSILQGLLTLPFAKFDKFNKPKIIGYTSPWVDPLKDGRAQIEGIEAKTLSMEDVLAENGKDLEDHLDQLAYEQEQMNKRNIMAISNVVRLPVPKEEAQ